jgi:hypothetical protein
VIYKKFLKKIKKSIETYVSKILAIVVIASEIAIIVV